MCEAWNELPEEEPTVPDKNELDELKERIVKLRLNDQLYLIEMVLAEHRRKWDEATSEMLRQIETLRELERQRAITDSLGGRREAG